LNALRTTTTCRDCGNQIPESLIADALCVSCRYISTKKPVELLDGDGSPVPTEYEIAADKFAFDAFADASQPPPAASADIRRDGIATAVLRFLKRLDEIGDSKLIGQTVKVLNFLTGQSGFETKTELARHLKVSPARITQILANFPEDLRSLARLKNRQQ
jgi:hypothetical protein